MVDTCCDNGVGDTLAQTGLRGFQERVHRSEGFQYISNITEIPIALLNTIKNKNARIVSRAITCCIREKGPRKGTHNMSGLTSRNKHKRV